LRRLSQQRLGDGISASVTSWSLQ